MESTLPFESADQPVWTITELTGHIKQALESDFANVSVQGEISEFTHAASGHVYMTLKDENAVLRAIIWRSRAGRLKFDLEEGLEVFARGDVEVYPPRGSYQLIVREIRPRGVGALQLAYQQLLQRLKEEGLFRPEHKVPLPAYPTRIGVITSGTGAAVRDIVRVIRRRWPPARIHILPRRVQGEGAAEEIAGAIHLLNSRRPDLDVLIVGRGGGSLEDLWAFNEEVVARAIYESELPVISAVGHEVDFPISDFVADVRAATPTEAGETVVPDRNEVMRTLQHLASRQAKSLERTVSRARERLEATGRRHVFRHPETLLREKSQRCDELFERLGSLFQHLLEMSREKASALQGRLEALSPLNVLHRGYGIATGPDGNVVSSVNDVDPGDELQLRVADGQIDGTVLNTRPADSESDHKDNDR